MPPLNVTTSLHYQIQEFNEEPGVWIEFADSDGKLDAGQRSHIRHNRHERAKESGNKFVHSAPGQLSRNIGTRRGSIKLEKSSGFRSELETEQKRKPISGTARYYDGNGSTTQYGCTRGTLCQPETTNFSAEGIESAIVNYERLLQNLLHSYDKICTKLENTEQRLIQKEDKCSETEATNILLQTRLRVLIAQESSNESYIHSLESQLEHSKKSEATYAIQITELRKEAARDRKNTTSCEHYISELEERLVGVDQDVTYLRHRIKTMQQTIEKQQNNYANEQHIECHQCFTGRPLGQNMSEPSDVNARGEVADYEDRGCRKAASDGLAAISFPITRPESMVQTITRSIAKGAFRTKEFYGKNKKPEDAAVHNPERKHPLTVSRQSDVTRSSMTISVSSMVHVWPKTGKRPEAPCVLSIQFLSSPATVHVFIFTLPDTWIDSMLDELNNGLLSNLQLGCADQKGRLQSFRVGQGHGSDHLAKYLKSKDVYAETSVFEGEKRRILAVLCLQAISSTKTDVAYEEPNHNTTFKDEVRLLSLPLVTLVDECSIDWFRMMQTSRQFLNNSLQGFYLRMESDKRLKTKRCIFGLAPSKVASQSIFTPEVARKQLLPDSAGKSEDNGPLRRRSDKSTDKLDIKLKPVKVLFSGYLKTGAILIGASGKSSDHGLATLAGSSLPTDGKETPGLKTPTVEDMCFRQEGLFSSGFLHSSVLDNYDIKLRDQIGIKTTKPSKPKSTMRKRSNIPHLPPSPPPTIPLPPLPLAAKCTLANRYTCELLRPKCFPANSNNAYELQPTKDQGTYIRVNKSSARGQQATHTLQRVVSDLMNESRETMESSKNLERRVEQLEAKFSHCGKQLMLVQHKCNYWKCPETDKIGMLGQAMRDQCTEQKSTGNEQKRKKRACGFFGFLWPEL